GGIVTIRPSCRFDSAIDLHCLAPGEALPALDRDLGVARVDLHRVAAPTELLRRDERRARAGERLVGEVTRSGAVAQAVGDQGDWLGGRVVAVGGGLRVLEDRTLAVVAIPVAARMPAAARSTRSRDVAIEDRLVAVLVVRVAEDDRALHPHELLVE